MLLSYYRYMEEIKVDSWEAFKTRLDELRKERANRTDALKSDLLFREQRNSCWSIGPTLDRVHKQMLFRDYYRIIDRIRPQVESFTESVERLDRVAIEKRRPHSRMPRKRFMDNGSGNLVHLRPAKLTKPDARRMLFGKARRSLRPSLSNEKTCSWFTGSHRVTVYFLVIGHSTEAQA
jgi:hypothetical protein